MVAYAVGEVFRKFEQARAIHLGVEEGALEVLVEVEGVCVHEVGPVALVGVLLGRCGGDGEPEQGEDAKVHDGCDGDFLVVYMVEWMLIAVLRDLRENAVLGFTLNSKDGRTDQENCVFLKVVQ